MKVVAAIVLGLLAVFGVGELADLTQNRPDQLVDGTSTVIAFDVGTRDYSGSDFEAAQALWAVCAATVPGDDSAVTPLDTGGFTVSVSPAFGTNGRKRLEGCLQDGTLDRVRGHIQSVVATEPAGAAVPVGASG
jgi:hypothetical protein